MRPPRGPENWLWSVFLSSWESVFGRVADGIEKLETEGEKKKKWILTKGARVSYALLEGHAIFLQQLDDPAEFIRRAGGWRRQGGGSLSTSGQRRWRRGSLTVPSSQELQVLPKAHPPWSLSGFPWLPWPGLTEVPKLGVELVSQRPKDQP